MTKAEVYQMISSTGLPCAYSHFSNVPDTPYLVYYYPAENDFFADNSNFANRRDLYIELYTKTKDFDAEATVETKLSAAGLTWYKTTDFLNDEKLFQTTYELGVLING